MRGAPFLNLVLAVALALMLGWLLVAGRSILLPVIAATICVYILTETSRMMDQTPVIRALPHPLRLASLLVLFTVVVASLGLVVTVTVDDFIAAAPRYQANIEALSARLAEQHGLDLPPTWEEAGDLVLANVNLQATFILLLGWITRFGMTAFLILVYAGFIMAERMSMVEKLAKAFPDGEQARRLGEVIISINHRIGRYLMLKTFVNIALAVPCYLILRWFGVDFPLFWAIIIGFSNYIPYVGSIVGVAFPVILSLAQFGSILDTVALGLCLTAVQVATGNFLEPWLMGRHLNLSRLVIIISLSFWVTLWGIPGAILAIPMTCMLMIVLSQFPETRFLAVFLSETGEPDGPVGPRERRARAPA